MTTTLDLVRALAADSELRQAFTTDAVAVLQAHGFNLGEEQLGELRRVLQSRPAQVRNNIGPRDVLKCTIGY
jgi:hypothetical protein